MRIQALYDLQQEINRLFIAGSKFAKNDPRLLKQVPIFNKLGEKAPIFKKISDEIVALTESKTENSSEKLTSLSTILYSILYTQGESFQEGKTQTANNPLFKLDSINTTHSYIDLKNVINALTSSGGGRLAIIEDAYKRGILNDFRIYNYLNLALSEKYSELSNFIEKIVIPSIGQIMIPYLLNSFSYEGRAEDVRRFSAIETLGYEGIDEMSKKILEGNSILLQEEAIKYLSRDIKNENIIIELTNDKTKRIRGIAYLCLANYGSETSLKKLQEIYLQNKRKGDLDQIVAAIKKTKIKNRLNVYIKRMSLNFTKK